MPRRLALLLAALAAPPAAASDAVRSAESAFTSPNGVVERCVRIAPMPGAEYAKGDLKDEEAYCAIDLYAAGVALAALRAGLAALALALAGQCAPTASPPAARRPPPAALPALSMLAGPGSLAEPGLAEQAAEVLARRCVACHGCYDAPCQLRLQSHEGLLRGATPMQVYDQTRLRDAAPTRLSVDATDAAGWRALGFHPVAPVGADADASVLARLLALGRANPPAPGAPLPEALSLDPAATVCPRPDEIDAFVAAAPHAGMPHGVAPLAEAEFRTPAAWALAGAPAPAPRAPPPPRVTAQVADWERFLNGPSPRERLVARTLYEHLFQARLRFEGDAPDRFFRLIRSSTPPGAPTREIATRRPFDDHGGPLRYRLIEARETPVHKDLNVYPNFHFDVAEAELSAFVEALGAMRAPGDRMALIDRFGVRR